MSLQESDLKQNTVRPLFCCICMCSTVGLGKEKLLFVFVFFQDFDLTQEPTAVFR